MNCRGCGVPVPPNRAPGRMRIWCSEACRKNTLYGGTCQDCGKRTHGGDGFDAPKLCLACASKRTGLALRIDEIETATLIDMYRSGMTFPEIDRAMGFDTPRAASRISRLRAMGYDIPHRHNGPWLQTA